MVQTPPPGCPVRAQLPQGERQQGLPVLASLPPQPDLPQGSGCTERIGALRGRLAPARMSGPSRWGSGLCCPAGIFYLFRARFATFMLMMFL